MTEALYKYWVDNGFSPPRRWWEVMGLDDPAFFEKQTIMERGDEYLVCLTMRFSMM